MILAEKIMSLRKQNGWSQEEFAEMLDVSRQSVSKWESGTSIPDIEKIIKMSQIFSVSTDYLLKESEDDEIKVERQPVNEENETVSTDKNLRQISMEYAAEYMDTIKDVSKKIAAGVVCCILSPIVLMILTAMSEDQAYNISEGFAVGVGLTTLFVFVAVGVLLFILNGMIIKKYEFLDSEPIKLMYGVESAVVRRKEAFEPAFRVCIAVGVILCILSAVPVAVSGAAGAKDVVVVAMVCILIAVVAIAVYLFVSAGMVYGSFSKLLQIDDFSVEKKRANKRYESAFGAYWCLVTAGYLAWSFVTRRWDFTWLVWPVAGVLFMPYKVLIESLGKRNDD